LVIKEFRLQALSFAISALCVLVWFIYHQIKHAPVLNKDAVFGLYGIIIPLIIGGISISSERSMGILPWQFTLPVSPLKQWGVKLSVVIFTCLLLGGLLLLLIFFIDSGQIPGGSAEEFAEFVLFSITLASLGVFASSISRTALRGIIAAATLFVFYFAMLAFAGTTGQPVQQQVTQASSVTPDVLAHANRMIEWLPTLMSWLFRIALFAFALCAAVFGCMNYREAVISHKRKLFQIIILCVLVASYSFTTKRLNAEFDASNKIVNEAKAHLPVP
jgi:hypothetical protein